MGRRRAWIWMWPALVLVAPDPCHAFSHMELTPEANGTSSYVLVQTNDTSQKVLEDIQTSQGAGASLKYDTAGVHLGIRYDAQAVEYSRHDILNRTDRQVNFVLDAARLMEHYTGSGKLSITANAKFTPALAPLDTAQAQPFDTPLEQQTDAEVYGSDPDAPSPELVAELISSQYLLNDIYRSTPGRIYVYGADYGNAAGEYSWVEMGGLITDAHFNSDVLPDRKSVNSHVRYTQRLLNGETGATVSYAGFLEGVQTDQRIWSLTAFFAKTGYRFNWRVGGGSTWRLQHGSRRIDGNGLVRIGYRWRRSEMTASYRSDMGFQSFGQVSPERVQKAYLTFSNKLNPRWNRGISLAWEAAPGDTAHRILAHHEYVGRNGFRAGLHYIRDGVHWTTENGFLHRRSADIVTFRLAWEM